MDGVPVDSETVSVGRDLSLIFTDDPGMEPIYLGFQAAGRSLSIPIELNDREIILKSVSRSADGIKSDRRIQEGEVQATFSQPTPPTISNAEYVGDADNEVTFYANGSTNDVSVWRSIDDEDFAVIDAAVAYNAGVFVDTDAGLDGDYAYKLTQEGVAGESNIRVAVVSGESGPTGSPPSGLSGSWNGGTLDVDLTWTNNSGTGNNIIERRINPTGSWVELASVSAATASYSDTAVVQLPLIHRTYYYRVRVTSAAGYSNEEAVYIPEE